MPAIDHARLKINAARLAEKFNQPEAFLHDFKDMLEFYANRTIRKTQPTQQVTSPAYFIPRPVMRQIESELVPLAEKQPENTLRLIKALWEFGLLESRLLAAYLLGVIPSELALPNLTLLPGWLEQVKEKEIRFALLTTAMTRIRKEKPEEFFKILEDWLGSARPDMQAWGMQALLPLLEDPHFENLPTVFRILRPAIQSAGPFTRLELQACLIAMEKVSISETKAFLRETILAYPTTMMLRTFLRILPGFSPGLQSALREVLREQRETIPYKSTSLPSIR